MTVGDIQRFSVHDGPGIRTTVFLKGCNLRCLWCHNPEMLRPEAKLQLFPDRCIACGDCQWACPQNAHRMTDAGREFDRARCVACGECAAVCYARALVLVGRALSEREVLREVLADREFYDASGGGVTLSGGEPLLQLELAVGLLRACKSEGIHTAIETNLAWPWEHMAAALPATDLIMLDIKMMDPAAHRRWTGVDNEQILENARRLSAEAVPLIVRTPVVAGVNATVGEIGRIADFISTFENLLYYELLPYHPLGRGKYERLGMEDPAEGLARPAGQTMRALAEAARQRGIHVRCPGDQTPEGNAE